MQVNAINSFSNVNFAGKPGQKAEKDTPNIVPAERPASKRFMSKLTGPAAAALFLVPIAMGPTGCTKIEVKAHAGVEIPFNPCPGDKDTVFIRDTIYIPPEFEFPYEIEDSLNHWRGDILDIPVDGDDGNLTNKALLYLGGQRQWENNRPEYIKLNLAKSDNDEVRYDHVIADSIKNDIRVTLVKPGELKIVKNDGSVTDEVSGLLFNEDGFKTFAHSNGKDSIYIYPKATSGDNNGKYVYRGVVGRGYLDKEKFGENVLLKGILSPGTPGDPEDPPTEDHYIKVNGMTMDVNELKDNAKEETIIIED